MNIPRRGDIFYADLSPVGGSKNRAIRPVLIVQNNTANKYSPYVIVVAITSNLNKPKHPTHVKISSHEYSFLKTDSVILLEQIRTLDKQKLQEKIGAVNEKTMNEISEGLMKSQGLLDINTEEYKKKLLKSLQERFYEFNSIIHLEENSKYEFKEFNNKYDNEIKTVHQLINKKLPEYACSILNSEKNCDGKIFFGVSDDRIIKGIEVNSKEKDDIRKVFYDSLDKIVPKIEDKSAFDIEFIRLKHNNEIKQNFYVIECTIPHSLDPEVLYFNGKNLHIRLNGRKQTIKCTDVETIQKIIRRRIYIKLEKMIKDKRI